MTFAQITRTQIINNGLSYTSITWTATSANKWNGISCGGKTIQTPSWVQIGSNTSMPYCWGGFTSTSTLQGYLNSGKSAGDKNTSTSFGAEPNCAVGVDCSGFVSRAWGLNSKYGTSTLPNISSEINYSQLQSGDIVNKEGDHTRLIKTYNQNGSAEVIEASGSDWKTSIRSFNPIQQTGYKARKYNNVTETGTPPGNFTLTLTPECNGATSQIKLNWTAASNVTTYDVYRNGSLYSPSGVGLTGLQFINSGNITVGASYSYYVKAKNSYGTTNSNTLTATALNCVTDNPPGVTSFTISSSSIVIGNSFTFFYSVTDDVGLSRVELWRTTDLNNAPNSNNWEKKNTVTLSGQKSNAGNFTDAPSTQGTYWYGIHAVDTKTQFTVEPNPPGPLKGIVNSSTSTVQITVNSNPAGLTFTVDGANFTSQQSFQWNVGSNHTISTSSPQSGGTGIRYLWSNWSDGGALSHTISIPSTSRTYTANFLIQYYLTLNLSPINSGSLNLSSNWYTNGDILNINATPNNGYVFTGWSGDASGTDNPLNFTMNRVRNITANFAVIPPTQYSVNLSSNPSNGGSTSGGGTYNSGQNVTVTATPNNGYTFSNWTENGNVISTSSNYSFTISSNRNLVANFTLIPPTQYSVNLSSNPSNGGTTNGGGTYNSGQNVTITATPNNGYTFTSWTENGILISTSSSYSFTISSNRNLVANFTLIPPTQYSVNLSSNPSNGGTTSGGGTYNSGQNVTITATPNNGYTFTNWTENENVISTSSNYNFNISSNRNLVANFYLIPPTQYSVNLSSNPPNGGTTSGGGTYNSGQNVTITATPNNSYTFTSWTENGNVISTSSNYSFIISSNRNLVANFALIPPTQYSVNLSSNPPNGGTTSGGGTYNSGQNVTVTATPNNGYTFTSWTENGILISTSSSYSFTISSNRNLVANFTLIPPTQYSVNLSSNPSNGGTTSGGGTYDSGQNVTATATPNNGYTFSNWTENGNVISTSSNYSFTISSNRNLVANFTLIPPTQCSVNLSSNPSNGGTTSGEGIYSSSQNVTITATPNNGYTFTSWTENGNIISTSSSYSFTISSNRNLVANFNLSSPTILLSKNSLADFGDVIIGQNSSVQSYQVSGLNLVSDITITAPAGFYISLNPSTDYGNSIVLKQKDGLVVGTIVYVRFIPILVELTTGEIIHRSNGAISKILLVNGRGVQKCLPVSIITQPDDQLVSVGGTAEFKVSVSGSGPFSYFWYKNSSVIMYTTNTDMTSYSLVLSNLSKSNDGESYFCDIFNCNSKYGVTTRTAVLTVTDISCAGVKINSQPQNQSVKLGEKATFSVSVTGTGPFSYYWYKNSSQVSYTLNTPLTTSSFTTSTINTYSSGDFYNCIVTNCNNMYQAKSSDALLNITTSVTLDDKSNIPKFYTLYQNYPNPFNPFTKICFDIPYRTHVKLSVYDLFGKEVEVLLNKDINAGIHEISFDGRNLSSGIYFYCLRAGDFSQMKKLLLVK